MRHLINIILILAIIGTISATVLLSYRNIQRSMHTEQDTVAILLQAAQDRVHEDYKVSSEQLEVFLRHPDENVRSVAMRLIAERRLAVGDSKEVEDVLKQLKLFVANESFSNLQRALTANFMFTWYVTNRPRSEQFFDLIFKGDPYTTYLSKLDMTREEIMRSAYEDILILSPTTNGNIRLANWYATRILEDTELPGDLKTQYLNQVRSYSDASWDLHFSVKTEKEAENFDLQDYNFALSRAMHLAVLQKSDLTNTDESFQVVLLNAERAMRKEGGLLRSRLADLLFYHAALLDYVYGDAQSVEIERKLEYALPLLKENKNNFIVLHLQGNQNLNSQRSPGYLDNFIERMAMYSIPFKQYVEEQVGNTEVN